MSNSSARTMRIPGSHADLTLRRHSDCETLEAGGRIYLLRSEQNCEYDGGFVHTLEHFFDNVLLRHVRTATGSWCEEYELDALARPIVVDGVRITRDDTGRVIECAGEAGCWRYAYESDRLVRVITPSAARSIGWSADRPAYVRNGTVCKSFAYDDAGQRSDAVQPHATIHRDEFGRAWTETDEDGNVVTTWLWDGFFCFGRVDGPPGEPLTAYFSLDPTGTPVRLVTRVGHATIPRDAFGENLLDWPGVPGLFGGCVRDGLVHYAGRTLDPRIGAFTALDPCDGDIFDPRRADGYRGPLPVETAYGGYAVCRNDPVGRADPTGMISWGVILSDLTWSLQNNTLGLFGLEMTINFWGSLLTLCEERSRGWFTTFQFETGKRQATWALVRRGLISREGRAWTFQHFLYDAPADLDALDICRVLSPADRFTPTYYGSVLRFTPDGAASVILGSDTNIPGTTNWTRAGGTAEAVFPGSSIPRFPAGGLHLDNAITTLKPGSTGNLIEMEPSGAVGSGTMQTRPRLTLTGTGFGLAPGALLFITNDARQAEILNVLGADEVDGNTSVWLSAMPAVVGLTNLRVRSLQPAAVSSEDMPLGPAPDVLDLAAATPLPSPPDYEIGDPLRFSQGGAPLGAGQIRAFEVRLRVDEALPALGPSAQVFRTSPGNGGNGEVAAGGAQLRITSGSPPPDVGEPVLVQAGAQSRACIVTTAATGDPALIPVDRSLSVLGVDGTPVTWTRLVTSVTALNATPPPISTGGDLMTYTPVLERTAPAVGRVIVIVDGATSIARSISAVIGDLIVLETILGAAGTITVERMRFVPPGTPGGIDQTPVEVSQFATISVAPAADVSGDVVRLIGINTPNVTVAAAATYTVINGAIADITMAAPPLGQFRPGSVTFLNNGAAGGEFALVRAVRARITLDRRIAAFDGVTELEIVQLRTAGPAWNAQRLGNLQVAVLPTIGALNWQLPRFAAGQFVQLSWTGASQSYRIASVELNGSTLTLEDGPDLPDPTPNLTVQRLDLGWQLAIGTSVINTGTIRPNAPGTGGNRLGIRGTCSNVTDAAGNPVSQLTVDIWVTNALSNNMLLAIFTVDTAHLAAIAGIALQIEFGAVPAIAASATAPVSMTVLTPALQGFSRQNRMEGANNVLVVLDAPFTAAPNNLVFVVPFRTLGDAVNITVSSGTTLVPDEPGFGDLERRQSLIDHELMHTEQSALWGPLLFCWFPMWAFYVPVELLTDIELPAFSPFVEAKVTENDRGRFLTIGANPRNVAFESGDVLQVTRQLTRRSTVNLVARLSPTRFRVQSITPGDLEAGPTMASPVEQETLGSVGALLGQDGDNWMLDIPDAGGLDFQEGKQALLLHGETLGALKLGTRDSENQNRFVIIEGSNVAADTTVMVRRENSTNPAWRTFFDIMYFLSGGGLTTWVFSHTWGRVIYYLFKLGYRFGRVFSDDPTQHTATVADPHTDLQFPNNTVPEGLGEATHVEVTGSSGMVIRRVTNRATGKLTLSAAVPFEGEVKVRIYTTSNEASAFDWKDYYPAIVPDSSQPTTIKIEAVDGETPSLATFDRLLLQSDARTSTSRVITVGNGLVQLEDPAPFSGPERRLQVAFLNADAPASAPTSSKIADEFLNPSRVIGMKGWLRLVTDLYGETYVRWPADNDVLRWIQRVGRWLFSSHSWSLAFPGWFFWDNMPHQLADEGHLSQMEQEASASSGDLYAPMSRLNPDGRGDQIVGDVSRMWFWPWGDRVNVNVIDNALRDAPGVHLTQIDWPILLPSVSPEINTTPVNNGAGTLANAGNQLPDALTFRDFTAALDAPIATMPPAYVPASTAFIPVSSNLERVVGAYVAFTTPGTHRVAVQDGINEAADARSSHDGGTSFGIRFSQPILFDVTVSDVTATVAGMTVANGTVVMLVATQRADVAVQPNGARRYAISMVQPDTSPVVRRVDDARIVAFAAGANQPVEISRVHTPGSGDLAEYGMHLLSDALHIPVRNFAVNVVDTIPLRQPLPDTATLLADVANANAVTAIRVGEEGFLIVPTELRGDPVIETVNGAPPGPDAPTVTPGAPPTVPEGMDAYLGTGAIVSVIFSTATPLTAPVDLRLGLPVGRPGNEADLHIDVRLEA